MPSNGRVASQQGAQRNWPWDFLFLSFFRVVLLLFRGVYKCTRGLYTMQGLVPSPVCGADPWSSIRQTGNWGLMQLNSLPR